jgi:hypothetical protein
MLGVALAMLGVALGAVVVEATTIVALRQPTHIILAADSLVVSSDDPTFSSRACKLRRAGQWWFLVGGQMEFGDGEPDSFTLASRAVEHTTTMKDALDALVSQEGPHLQRRFAALAVRYPTAKPFLHVIIGGVEHGRLMLGLFLVDLKQREPFELRVQRLATQPDDEPLYYTGSVDWDALSTKLMKKPRPAWLQRGDAAAARQLIHMQSVDTPTKVGPPIDVLEITTAGARWVLRDPESKCAP